MARTVTVRARALKDADSHFISIVDKGANRLPIRMLKNEDDSMINMGLNVAKLFNRQKAEAKPEAVGIIVGAPLAAGFAAALKAEGYETVEIVDCGQEDLRFVSTKSEVNLEDAIKLNGLDRAIVLENGQKMLKDWGFDDDNTFAASVAANSFYSTMHSAMDTLGSAIYQKMEDAPMGTRPTEDVTKLLSDFSAYMLALLNTVPETAFKMEKIQPLEVEEAQDPESTVEGVIVEGQDTTTDEANNPVVDTEVVEASNSTTEGAPTVEAEVVEAEVVDTQVEGGASGEVTEEGQKSENVQLTAILQQITNIAEGMTGMKSELETLRQDVAGQGDTMEQITTRIAKAEKTAKQSLEASLGTVVDTSDDETQVAASRKSEGGEYQFKASNIETA
ncbi:transport and binding protein [Vibrio phage vB_VpS_PG28]|nr:transport and binding protein [Vibrio phage vB_VpS_PG28]